MENKKKLISIILIIVLALAAIAEVSFIYWQYSRIHYLEKELEKINRNFEEEVTKTPIEKEEVNSCKDLENQLSSMQNNLVNPISKHTEEIKDWNLYLNNDYKFRIDYPNTFLIEEYDETQQKNYGSIIKLLVFDEKARDLGGNDMPGYYNYATISYWDDINDDYLSGGSWEGEREYENLDDLLTDNPFIQKTRELQLNGNKAYEVAMAGHGTTFGIIMEYNNGIYRIEFSESFQHPPDNTIKEKIISSFKFID
jgi:hypothetical protein